jgi:hypothetical protein
MNTKDDNRASESFDDLMARLRDFSGARNRCFLCGHSLAAANYTDEHVVPAWAQRRHDLWNQKLTLINKTTLSYRNLTVPCCAECNGTHLKPLEDSLAKSVDVGVHAVRALDRSLLFLWLGKIFYGILFKELQLLADRTDPTAGTILTPADIDHYEMHRFFLQQARDRVRLLSFNPGSVFVFPMQDLPSRRIEWDLVDNVQTMFIGVRVGKVGFLAALADGGAQQANESHFNDIADMPLHPLQFRELCAYVSYSSTLATRTPKYLITEGKPHSVIQLPLGGMSARPLFEGWDPQTYGQFLAYYTGLPLDDVFAPPDKTWTWIYDEQQKPRFLPFAQAPELPGGPMG